MEKSIRVLVLESSSFYSDLCKNGLVKVAYTVCVLPHLAKAKNIVEFKNELYTNIVPRSPDLIVVDVNFNIFILETIKEIRQVYKDMRFVYTCALGKKYARNMKNLPQPCLREEEIKDNPQILVDFVRKTLKE